MSTLTRTEWQDCAWAARFHRDRRALTREFQAEASR